MHSLHLICQPEQVDALSGELWEEGTAGVREVDTVGAVELIAGFDDSSRGPDLLARFADYQAQWKEEADTDWVQETQDAWPPREIGSRIFLAPPWFTGDTPTGRVRIAHNPGSASGTGEHPCTQLMLENLEASALTEARVLDVGTGSGILAIAALRLGGRSAYGLDTDDEALKTARENFELNALPPSLIAGSLDCVASACADIVLANISGTVLLAIFDDLLRVARPGAQIVLSGFTGDELQPFLKLLPGAHVTSRNEWRCVSAEL